MFSPEVNNTFAMTTGSQDSSVTSSGELLNNLTEEPLVNVLVNHLMESSLEQEGKENSQLPFDCKLAKLFPWLIAFKEKCQEAIGTTDITTLEKLMTDYIKKVKPCVNDCYLKPNRAAKLKICMNDTLLLFHMLYSEMKKPLEHSSYLNKMSDLMAMYIDMEVKASRRGKESLPKIASKLTSALYIFLDRSQDHILDSILKTKYMNKNFWELCVMIFSRVLRDSPGRAVYEMTYVRYILAFKMWKKVFRSAKEKRKVLALASMKLFPPAQFKEKLKAGLLNDVIPKIPKSKENITTFLMQAKFCTKEKITAFLKAVGDPKQQGILGSQLPADFDGPLFFGDDSDNLYNSNSDEQEDTSSSNTIANQSNNLTYMWSRMSLKSGVTDHHRLASVITAKTKKIVKNKSKKSVVKCKGKSESNGNKKSPVKKRKPKEKPAESSTTEEQEKIEVVPPEEPSIESESVEVDKKVEIVTGAEPLKVTLEPEKPTAPVLPLPPPEIVEKPAETKPLENVTPEILISNIKVEEPDSDDVCIIGYVNGKDKEQVNQIDSVCQGDKETEMVEVAEELEIRSESPCATEAKASKLPCQQADVSSVKVEYSNPPAGNETIAKDILLYDEEMTVLNPTDQYSYPISDIINKYFNNSQIVSHFDLGSIYDTKVVSDPIQDLSQSFRDPSLNNLGSQELIFQTLENSEKSENVPEVTKSVAEGQDQAVSKGGKSIGGRKRTNLEPGLLEGKKKCRRSKQKSSFDTGGFLILRKSKRLENKNSNDSSIMPPPEDFEEIDRISRDEEYLTEVISYSDFTWKSS